MAYTVKIHGVEITCDSPQEVSALLAALGTSTDGGTSRHMPEQSSRQAIQSLVKSLPEEQKRLVQLLNEVWPEHATDRTIRAQMQLPQLPQGNKKLAGILSGIAKMSKRAGLGSMVRHESVRGTTGDREHKYWLENEVHAALNG